MQPQKAPLWAYLILLGLTSAASLVVWLVLDEPLIAALIVGRRLVFTALVALSLGLLRRAVRWQEEGSLDTTQTAMETYQTMMGAATLSSLAGIGLWLWLAARHDGLPEGLIKGALTLAMAVALIQGFLFLTQRRLVRGFQAEQEAVQQQAHQASVAAADRSTRARVDMVAGLVEQTLVQRGDGVDFMLAAAEREGETFVFGPMALDPSGDIGATVEGLVGMTIMASQSATVGFVLYQAATSTATVSATDAAGVLLIREYVFASGQLHFTGQARQNHAPGMEDLMVSRNHDDGQTAFARYEQLQAQLA